MDVCLTFAVPLPVLILLQYDLTNFHTCLLHVYKYFILYLQWGMDDVTQ